MFTLYIVATPIGNLEDITLRAVRILSEVDLVLCEDTRTTRKLLERYEIKTPTESYPFDTVRKGRVQKANPKAERIVRLLEEGKNLALVSEAGTPGISDPGGRLVSKIREHFGDAAEVVAIPGPSAAAAALSVSGLPSSEFLFLGFLPHKKGREKLFKEIAESKRTVVFYESPHRIVKTLRSLAEHLQEDRRVVVARELTKIHEETISGTPQEILEYFAKYFNKVRGEFVVMVSM